METATDRTTDEEHIAAVVRDYYESWYEGDAERMRRALHPNLAKRAPMASLISFRPALSGDPDSLDEDTATSLVESTPKGTGTTRVRTPEERAIDIEVHGVYP